MDALSYDYMQREYQEKVEEPKEKTSTREERSSSPPAPPPPPTSKEDEFDYEAEVGSAETVEAVQVELNSPSGAAQIPSGSTSSSNNSVQEGSSIGASPPSFYLPSVMTPSINYDRDFPAQKLIAVFGRQFDRPDVVASNLQKLISEECRTDAPAPSAKFLPFTMKRKSLLKGSYSSNELKKHNLICMCYNASEARILLTGVDGFYSSLLKHVEAVLGSNKVAFVVTSYNWPEEQHNRGIISPALRTRLSNQEAIRMYLDKDQVLSWMDTPSQAQAQKLVELACLDANPQSIMNQASCAIL